MITPMEIVDKIRNTIKDSLLLKKFKHFAYGTHADDEPLKSVTKEELEEVGKRTIKNQKSQTKKAQEEPLRDDILGFLKGKTDGVKQPDIYQEVGQKNRKKATILLAKMAKEGVIKRQKQGNTYTVFEAN